MNLGICQGCRNKCEVHEGLNGRWYCEDCLARDKTLDPMSKGVEGGKFKAPEPESKRARYLEYIITHVTDPWIDKFLDEWKLEMKRSYGWVQELRKIEDDMVLLRLAAELGFAKKVEYQAPINHETISLGKEVVYAESGRKSKKGVSRDTEKENG